MDLKVEDWGFAAGEEGRLLIAGTSAEKLAREHGTPLHVIDEDGLRRTAYDLFHGIDYGEKDSSALYFNQLAEVIRLSLERGATCLSRQGADREEALPCATRSS